MSPSDRRRLIETPIRFNIYGTRSWSGHTVHAKVPTDGQRVRSIVIINDEIRTHAEDLAYVERD